VVAAHGAELSNFIFAEIVAVVELHTSQMMVPIYYYLGKSMGREYQLWRGGGDHFEDSFSVVVEHRSLGLYLLPWMGRLIDI
jgi:hypothetical protein